VAEGGEIEYTVIPRTVDRLVNFVDCIKLHSETYRAIVDVVQFLWEHGVPLDRKQYDGD